MKMSVRWKWFVNSGNLEIKETSEVNPEYLIHWFVTTKIFFCYLISQHHTEWSFKCILRTSFKDICLEEIKKLIICPKNIGLVEYLLFKPDNSCTIIQRSRDVFNLLEVIYEPRPK